MILKREYVSNCQKFIYFSCKHTIYFSKHVAQKKARSKENVVVTGSVGAIFCRRSTSLPAKGSRQLPEGLYSVCKAGSTVAERALHLLQNGFNSC